MKIQLTSKNKIKNPIDNEDNNYSFEGNFDEIMFNEESEQYLYLKNQKVNFENLKNKFENMNLNFEYIWLGNFNNSKGHKSINFIIKTNQNEEGKKFFWQKYCTATPGSGQNWLYIIKNDKIEKKIQTLHWLEE